MQMAFEWRCTAATAANALTIIRKQFMPINLLQCEMRAVVARLRAAVDVEHWP